MYQIQTYFYCNGQRVPDHAGPDYAVPMFSEPGFFFNEIEQLGQQDGGFHLITALNERTQLIDARCAVFMANQLALSPKQAPFGSVEFVGTLPKSVLRQLIDALEQTAAKFNIPALRLTDYPRAYAPRQADRLTDEWQRRGYQPVEQTASFHLDVTDAPLPPRMHPSERRRLLKCRRAGFQVRTWENPDVAAVVDFITQSRQRQGYALTISPDRLTYLLATYPDKYPIIAVFDGDTIASLVVAVRVRIDILYAFLPADNLSYRPYSPAVLLTEGLYAYCQQQRIALLDLGVAVDGQRQPKPGLMRFKRNLGAIESPKMSWEKRF